MNEDKAEIFLDMPFFKRPKKLADLERSNLTLKLMPKSRVNIFHLFGEGIGINEEMITRLNFDFIECEINGIVYKTTKKHFLKKAIRSPYQSAKVDRQWVLRIEDFYTPDDTEPVECSLSLFEQAS